MCASTLESCHLSRSAQTRAVFPFLSLLSLVLDWFLLGD